MNVILVGMPGAGKSTIGVVLAKAMRKMFVDTDIIIQQKVGVSLQEYIDQYGQKKFLEIEEQYILQLDIEDTVIATGGSVIYSSAAIKHLKRSGIIIYLQLEYHEIETRLGDFKGRGIAMEPGSDLKAVYNSRVMLYERDADLIIDCNGKLVSQIVIEIMTKLNVK